MKLGRIKKFRIKIEDESRLETVADFSISPWRVVGVAAFLVAAMILLGTLLVMLTPLRTLLPGYMKQSERAQTEDNILRLDSLRNAYQMNEKYLMSVIHAMDTDREAKDSTSSPNMARELSPDSLLPASRVEKQFVNMVEERERFNISVLAPLAAEGMMFSPVADGAVFTAASRKGLVGDILIQDTPVMSIADGSVLASYYSPQDYGYVVIVQHRKGFVSRIAHVGSPMVSAGDQVTAGQVIAAPPPLDARGQRRVSAMIWHNGARVVPYEYIGTAGTKATQEASFDAPRGQ